MRRGWLRLAAMIQWRPAARRGTPAASPRYPRGFPPAVRQVGLVVVSLAFAWWLLVALVPGRSGMSLPPRTVVPSSYAPPLPPPPNSSPLAVALAGPPSLDANRVNGILAAYGSPLRGQGKALVALSARYKVDDAVAMAFFVMESRAGTQGEAVLTHSFGNLRPMPGAPSVDGYRFYDSWLDGATEWFQLIRSLYLDTLKLNTVEAVVPVYAPSSDNNQPAVMVAGIHQLVTCWRGDVSACPDEPTTVRALVTGS
ncbi:MAG TPA: hypothetical protein VN837_07540 [Chloroflexota bacterium]|nr:hypothetical protein [Chloroflexota bacterium]